MTCPDFLTFLSPTLRGRFIKNYITCNKEGRTLTYFFAIVAQEDYVNSAFVWADTPEGPSFWQGIEFDWRDYIR